MEFQGPRVANTVLNKNRVGGPTLADLSFLQKVLWSSRQRDADIRRLAEVEGMGWRVQLVSTRSPTQISRGKAVFLTGAAGTRVHVPAEDGTGPFLTPECRNDSKRIIELKLQNSQKQTLSQK